MLLHLYLPSMIYEVAPNAIQEATATVRGSLAQVARTKAPSLGPVNSVEPPAPILYVCQPITLLANAVVQTSTLSAVEPLGYVLP